MVQEEASKHSQIKVKEAFKWHPQLNGVERKNWSKLIGLEIELVIGIYRGLRSQGDNKNCAAYVQEVEDLRKTILISRSNPTTNQLKIMQWCTMISLLTAFHVKHYLLMQFVHI